MDTVKEGIRLNLLDLLEKSGRKKSELADALGVQRSAVTNWTNGSSSIDIERIPGICQFFGVDVGAFFSRSEELEPAEKLTSDERELVGYFRQLPPNGKHAVLAGLKDYASKQ